MARGRLGAEQIVTKLRQIEVLQGQGNSTHILGTHVPVEEPSTASKDGVISRQLVDS